MPGSVRRRSGRLGDGRVLQPRPAAPGDLGRIAQYEVGDLAHGLRLEDGHRARGGHALKALEAEHVAVAELGQQGAEEEADPAGKAAPLVDPGGQIGVGPGASPRLR